MSLLRTEPAEAVRTLDELFAVARLLEEEASARYAELAERMRALDLPEVAAVFDHLAAEERGHAGQVEGWARSETGAPPDPARIRWRPPETSDVEEVRAIGSSRLASAYRALSMAVRDEERAFALWTYIAAQAEDPGVRRAAERMAGEELRHAALLRRERRRAFHAERGRQAPEAVAASAPPPPAERAAQAERALAAALSVLAAEDEAAGQASELKRMAAEAASLAGDAARPRDDDRPRSAPSGTTGGLPAALRLAEQAVEAYLEAADAARDEARMRRLQSQADRAIARLALLRQMAGRSR